MYSSNPRDKKNSKKATDKPNNQAQVTTTFSDTWQMIELDVWNPRLRKYNPLLQQHMAQP